MSTITDSLEKAGFEPSVAQIYTILAESGELSVGQIVEKSKLSRAGAYDALNLLLAQAYIEYRKEGRNAFYKAVHPDKLYGLIEEKRRETTQLEDEVKGAIKALTGAFNLTQNKPGVRFFEGIDGIREVIFDSLSAKKEILTFLDVDATQQHIEDINREYVKERVRLGIKKRQIAPDTEKTRTRYQNYSPLLEVRLMPPNIKPFQTSIQIYNNTVSFSTLNDKKMIGIIIEDEQIAMTIRSLFECIWQTGQNVTINQPPDSSPSAPRIPPMGHAE